MRFLDGAPLGDLATYLARLEQIVATLPPSRRSGTVEEVAANALRAVAAIEGGRWVFRPRFRLNKGKGIPLTLRR